MFWGWLWQKANSRWKECLLECWRIKLSWQMMKSCSLHSIKSLGSVLSFNSLSSSFQNPSATKSTGMNSSKESGCTASISVRTIPFLWIFKGQAAWLSFPTTEKTPSFNPSWVSFLWLASFLSKRSLMIMSLFSSISESRLKDNPRTRNCMKSKTAWRQESFEAMKTKFSESSSSSKTLQSSHLKAVSPAQHSKALAPKRRKAHQIQTAFRLEKKNETQDRWLEASKEKTLEWWQKTAGWTYSLKTRSWNVRTATQWQKRSKCTSPKVKKTKPQTQAWTSWSVLTSLNNWNRSAFTRLTLTYCSSSLRLLNLWWKKCFRRWNFSILWAVTRSSLIISCSTCTKGTRCMTILSTTLCMESTVRFLLC